MTEYYSHTGYVEDEPQHYDGEDWESQPPVAVKSVGDGGAPEYGACMTWPIPQAGSGQQPVQMLQRRLRRNKARITVTSIPTTITTPGVTQPAVPASTVAQQNVNQFPVQVVITGGTLTAVFVNGIQVGTTAGTYTVPANGSISITYTVAPTWVWTALTTVTTTGTIMLNSKLDPLQGSNPQGFTVSATGNLPPWESQQPLYAIAVGGTGSISVWDEAFAER